MTGPENGKSSKLAQDKPARESADAEARTCVQCGKPAVHTYRPFCSRRCADIDLARWLGGRYAIAAKPEIDDED